MSDFNSNRPIKDYYREAQSLRAKPCACPHCKRQGKLATNWYEVGKRVPLVMAEGIATCSEWHGLAQTADGVLRGDRIWYCDRCAICLCGDCQRRIQKS